MANSESAAKKTTRRSSINYSYLKKHKSFLYPLSHRSKDNQVRQPPQSLPPNQQVRKRRRHLLYWVRLSKNFWISFCERSPRCFTQPWPTRQTPQRSLIWRVSISFSIFFSQWRVSSWSRRRTSWMPFSSSLNAARSSICCRFSRWWKESSSYHSMA